MSAIRIVVIGNRGGGKSTLSRRLATKHRLTHIEIDTWLDRAADYEAQHAQLIAQESWLIDGLGSRSSIPARLARATEIVLMDLPLWMHAALTPDRFAWPTPDPQSINASRWHAVEKIERENMPDIRKLCREAEARGATLIRIESADMLERFAAEL